MNPSLARYGKVPFVGDLMASRWAFESLCLAQFRYNSFDSQFFKINKGISKASFKIVYWLPEMNSITNELNEALIENDSKSINQAVLLIQKLRPILQFEVAKENKFNRQVKFPLTSLKTQNISFSTILELEKYLSHLERYYRKKLQLNQSQKDRMVEGIIEDVGKEGYLKMYQASHNEALDDFLTRKGEEYRIIHADGHLVQQTDPIYNDEVIPRHPVDYRSHFFSPYKYFVGRRFDTFWFDIYVLWFMVFALFLALYFDLLKRIVEFRFKM